MTNFRFESDRHDTGSKTIFGHRRQLGLGGLLPRSASRTAATPPSSSTKLWSYFVPTPPSADTLKALIGIYKHRNYAIRPVLEAILMHPDLYRGPPMVKPPVVYLAGMLRSLGRGDRHRVTGSGSASRLGQQLFRPPNVSGWDDGRWLDTSTMQARWTVVTYALEGHNFDAWDESYPEEESIEEALNSALGAWGWPALRAEHQNELTGFAQAGRGPDRRPLAETALTSPCARTPCAS